MRRSSQLIISVAAIIIILLLLVKDSGTVGQKRPFRNPIVYLNVTADKAELGQILLQVQNDI